MKRNYIIIVDGKKVEVNEAVYKAYWYGHNKEKKFKERDFYHNVLYFDALDTEDGKGSEFFFDPLMDIAAEVEKKFLYHELYQCIGRLSSEDKELIQALYFDEKTLKQFGREKGVSAVAIFKRNKKVIKRLKEIFLRRNER